ncbi:MAG: DUF2071 domain-containing protein [Polyangiaceae bacterium]|jgi:uncharacterized protein YqjF (DUF2071 family)|nr:DUF2071 domain-containing protein [Polyangiaceae bacterium]
MSAAQARMATLAALAGAPAGLSPGELVGLLTEAGLGAEQVAGAAGEMLERGEIGLRGGVFELAPAGARALLEIHAAIERALDPSPTTPGMEECPSIPWLTTVQTRWLDAVSLNVAVSPDALRPLIPAPLEPEVFHGTAWVQVLISRLQEMRPQGAPPLFGVNFHQVSYRAAVRYRSRSGAVRRGGFFVRSETDNALMRAVGNALVEFRFHDFGLAKVALKRSGGRLDVSVTPEPRFPGGQVAAALDVSRDHGPPRGSAWASLDELRAPLVECYDAFGVDAEQRWVYVLTIDRGPWDARFARADQVRCELLEAGPLRGAARLDSVLHLPQPCPYRWRPLRRERW